jgi:CPA1 family monovalent cation:H+ antiporter
MTATIQTLLLLLAVLVVVAVVARRLNIAVSILLVVAGIALALIPGLPRIALAPELVLFGILPPLIYSAGVAMSWREFRFNLRPIILLAFGCILFTAWAVAAVSHYLLGMPWAVGFVLGAIVAPTDAVAPLAVVRRLGLPRRLIVVLEGEGLANDATALILYRFAVAAVGTGVFSASTAAGEFVLIVVGEIACGLVIGFVSLRLRRLAQDPRVEITLSLMTPYVAFLLPAQLGGSGVLATVAAGLYVSWNGPLLIPAATRLQGIFFWDLLIYLLEGLVFLVTGLQLRILIERTDPVLLQQLALAVPLVVAVVLAARFIWVYPAAYIPRWLSPALARRDPVPTWQFLFMLGFTGVRGVVSLAAALALPLTTSAGTPFPDRDLILFIAFGVIVVTLIGEGVVLAPVVRWLALPRDADEERRRENAAELKARLQTLKVAEAELERLSTDGNTESGVLEVLRAGQEHRIRQLPKDPRGKEAVAAALALRAELIDAERAYIYQLLRDGQITDEARRRIERELDLEEAAITLEREDEEDPPL